MNWYSERIWLLVVVSAGAGSMAKKVALSSLKGRSGVGMQSGAESMTEVPWPPKGGVMLRMVAL